MNFANSGSTRLNLYRYSLLVAVIILISGCVSMEKPVSSELTSGDHIAIINGQSIHYHVSGKGPVCIVHPGGPGFDWSYMKMPEVEKFLTLVYLEPIGSGKSDRLTKPKDYTIKRYTFDLEEFRKYLGMGKIMLLGHSHGGMVSLNYAIKYPDNLDRLILTSTSSVTDGQWINDMLSNFAKHKEESWYVDAITAFGSASQIKSDKEGKEIVNKISGFYFVDYEKNREWIDSFIGSMGVSYMPNLGFTIEMGSYDLRSDLDKIKTPTLVISGEKDDLFPLKYQNILVEGISKAKLSVIPDAGHYPHRERPIAYSEAIRMFVVGL